jgi:hypothetical protein
VLLGKSNAEDSEWFPMPIPNAKAEGKSVRVNVNRQQFTKALEFGLTQVEIIDPLSALRMWNDGKQMILMPVRVDGSVQTSATHPNAPESKAGANTTAPKSANESTTKEPGEGEAETVAFGVNESAAATEPTTTERRQRMPEEPTTPPNPNTRTGKSTENGFNVEMLIDQTLSGIEELQEALDDNVQTLNGLRAKAKILSREYKASTKEVESLKKTLRGLQGMKL